MASQYTKFSNFTNSLKKISGKTVKTIFGIGVLTAAAYEGLDILDMNNALKKYSQIFNDYFSKIYTYKNDYFSSENMLQINNGIFIFVKKNYRIDLPLECIFSSIDLNNQIFQSH